jgi:nudix-type nucleoside diphosphatase (YffH/AdpP family)
MPGMTLQHRLRVQDVQVLSDDWYVLKKTTFDWQRRDGQWQRVSRETYDRGNGATLLPYHLGQRSVLLTRQFRYPAYVNGHDDLLIEAPAGLLDNSSPEERIRAEVEEETGYRLQAVRRVFQAFMSPGSVTERLHFFVGAYDHSMRVDAGGGVAEEGEDIEVLELGIDTALAMVEDGRIQDGKTILLLQWAAMNLFRAPGSPGSR